MKLANIFEKYRRLTIIIVSAVVTQILLLCVNYNPYIAAKITGVDNLNVRSLYYTATFGGEGVSYGDSIVIYQPLCDEVPDKRKKIAEELFFLCQFHPKAIIFDYIFEKEYDFTKKSDELLLAAIKGCIDSGVKFYAPYVCQGTAKINFFHKYCNIEKGNVLVPNGIIESPCKTDSIPWMPTLVSGKNHSKTFYKYRGIEFTEPAEIQLANHSEIYTIDSLKQILYNKYVIFSDTQDRADLKSMSFPTYDVRDGDKYELSGATQLWYFMRSEIYNRWDCYLPSYIAILFAIIIGFFYLFSLDLLCKNPNESFKKRLIQYSIFIVYEIGLIPLIGIGFMSFHYVMPLAQSAIILVIINIFRYEK